MAKIPKYEPMVFDLPVNYVKTKPALRRLVREQYVRDQDGLCWHCGKRLTDESGEVDKEIPLELFPRHFFTHPVHLHHCHRTDMTIGAVHAHCNAVLWHWYGV